MVILRLLSYLLIASTLMLLGYDAVTWLQASNAPHSLYSLGKLVNDIAGSDVTAGLPDAAKMVFHWPSWAVTGVIGLIFAFVSRRHG